ncbi:hypothetical protein [Rubritalea sp.]|uniref:hypothetical protein n=1 Tax=Rubritalea sp. TaxID=2109375 RepID=UPI003242ADD7
MHQILRGLITAVPVLNIEGTEPSLYFGNDDYFGEGGALELRSLNKKVKADHLKLPGICA